MLRSPPPLPFNVLSLVQPTCSLTILMLSSSLLPSFHVSHFHSLSLSHTHTHTHSLSLLLSHADPRAVPPKAELPEMTVAEAIRLIQIHERARQGRLRAKFMADIRFQEQRERRRKEAQGKKLSRGDAAVVIQRMTRGFLTRCVGEEGKRRK